MFMAPTLGVFCLSVCRMSQHFPRQCHCFAVNYCPGTTAAMVASLLDTGFIRRGEYLNKRSLPIPLKRLVRPGVLVDALPRFPGTLSADGVKPLAASAPPVLGCRTAMQAHDVATALRSSPDGPDDVDSPEMLADRRAKKLRVMFADPIDGGAVVDTVAAAGANSNTPLLSVSTSSSSSVSSTLSWLSAAHSSTSPLVRFLGVLSQLSHFPQVFMF